MFTPAYTRQFERDVKLLRRRGLDLTELRKVMESLIAGKRLSPKFKEHKLIGAWRGRRECHLHPDWLLIYKIAPEQNLIIFERTGSHTDLFG